jgi:hypothetical protein
MPVNLTLPSLAMPDLAMPYHALPHPGSLPPCRGHWVRNRHGGLTLHDGKPYLTLPYLAEPSHAWPNPASPGHAKPWSPRRLSGSSEKDPGTEVRPSALEKPCHAIPGPATPCHAMPRLASPCLALGAPPERIP